MHLGAESPEDLVLSCIQVFACEVSLEGELLQLRLDVHGAWRMDWRWSSNTWTFSHFQDHLEAEVVIHWQSHPMTATGLQPPILGPLLARPFIVSWSPPPRTARLSSDSKLDLIFYFCQFALSHVQSHQPHITVCSCYFPVLFVRA